MKEVIFPENITSIMKEILERYERRETLEEMLEKSTKGIKTNGEKLRDLLLRLVYDEINSAELPEILEKEFDLTPGKAFLMAHDIQEKILNQIEEKEEIEPIEESEKSKLEEEKEEIEKKFQRIQKDIYREPLE